MKNKGLIFDIQRNSFVDGPGIRTTVFFKGCNLQCQWCHNPESQSAEKQLLIYAGKYEDCGQEYTPEELLAQLQKDKRFYDASGGGVTMSGGECMLQIDFLEQVLKLCKQAGIHTAVDTAGCVAWERFLQILPYADLFLYDVKSMDPKVHREYTGVDNQQILQNLAQLLRLGTRVIVRFPVVPGVNDTCREMELLGAFYGKNGYPEKTELLPYHKLGEHKYTAMGRQRPCFEVPGEEKLTALKAVLAESKTSVPGV